MTDTSQLCFAIFACRVSGLIQGPQLKGFCFARRAVPGVVPIILLEKAVERSFITPNNSSQESPQTLNPKS